MRFIAVKTLLKLRLFTGAAALFGVTSAQALILDVQITPADGFVTVGQEVGMVLTVTNDSSPRPGFTILRTNDIDGLSFPFEIPPCVLGVAQLNPPTSSISYSLSWDLVDLQANETRRCETKFRIRTIPNGVIPINFRNGLVNLTSVTFRAKPLVAVSSMTPFGIFVLCVLFLLTVVKGQKND